MGGGHRQISYAYFTAFISLLNNLELVQKLYLACTRRDKTMEVTKGTVVYSIYKENFTPVLFSPLPPAASMDELKTWQIFLFSCMCEGKNYMGRK